MTDIISRIADQLHWVALAFRDNLLISLLFVAFLFVMHIINLLTNRYLSLLGIIPRHLLGLPGIILSPFIHSNWNHLFLNSIPLLILTSLLLIHGVAAFMVTTLIIMLIGGGLTWCFGQRGIHIGASSLIMGYWSFTLTQAIIQFNLINMLISLLCLFYLSHLIINIFPSGKRNVSWEGHLFGAIAGVAAVYILPYTFTLLSSAGFYK